MTKRINTAIKTIDQISALMTLKQNLPLRLKKDKEIISEEIKASDKELYKALDQITLENLEEELKANKEELDNIEKALWRLTHPKKEAFNNLLSNTLLKYYKETDRRALILALMVEKTAEETEEEK